MTARRARGRSSISSDLMDHLREEGCDILGDLGPQHRGGALPATFGPDENAITSLSSARAISPARASAESLLGAPSDSRGTRLVAPSGSFSSTRPWWATRAWPSLVECGLLTETTEKRRPKSGCLGSVTSISTKSLSAGFWKGVSTDVLEKRSDIGVENEVHLRPADPDGQGVQRIV